MNQGTDFKFFCDLSRFCGIAEITFWQGMEHAGLIAAIMVPLIAWLAYRGKTRTKIENNPLKVDAKIRQARASEKDCKERHHTVMDALEKLKNWVMEKLDGVSAKFESTEKDHDAEHRRLYGKIEDVHGEVSEKIDTLNKKVAGLERDTQNQNRMLERMDVKLDTLLIQKP